MVFWIYIVCFVASVILVGAGYCLPDLLGSVLISVGSSLGVAAALGIVIEVRDKRKDEKAREKIAKVCLEPLLIELEILVGNALWLIDKRDEEVIDWNGLSTALSNPLTAARIRSAFGDDGCSCGLEEVRKEIENIEGIDSPHSLSVDRRAKLSQIFNAISSPAVTDALKQLQFVSNNQVFLIAEGVAESERTDRLIKDIQLGLGLMRGSSANYAVAMGYILDSIEWLQEVLADEKKIQRFLTVRFRVNQIK